MKNQRSLLFEKIMEFPAIKNFLNPDAHRLFYKKFFKKPAISQEYRKYITTNSVARLPKADKWDPGGLKSALSTIIKPKNYDLDLKRAGADQDIINKFNTFNTNLKNITTKKVFGGWVTPGDKDKIEAFYFLFSKLIRETNSFSTNAKTKDPVATLKSLDEMIDLSEKLGQPSWKDTFIKSIVRSNPKTYPDSDLDSEVSEEPRYEMPKVGEYFINKVMRSNYEVMKVGDKYKDIVLRPVGNDPPAKPENLDTAEAFHYNYRKTNEFTEPINRSGSNLEEQLTLKLEPIIESYINNRKQQWRKRTM